MKRIESIIFILITIEIVLAVLFLPFLPPMIASHWDMYDLPDKYLPKEIALFIIPVLSIILYSVFTWLPKLDPYKDNIERFKTYYFEFLLVLLLFFFYMHFAMIIWNSGIRFRMGQILSPAFGALFFYVGMLLSKTRRNYVIGVRTPWTVRDDRVWDKTHIFAGNLFKIAGAVACLGFLLPDHTIYFILAPVLLALFYTVFYSYIEYRMLPGKKKKSR